MCDIVLIAYLTMRAYRDGKFSSCVRDGSANSW